MLELVKDPEVPNGKGVSPKPDIKQKASTDKIPKKVAAKPEEKKTAQKDEAPDASDPIDFALWHRKQAGLDSIITEAEAKKKKIVVPAPLKL